VAGSVDAAAVGLPKLAGGLPVAGTPEPGAEPGEAAGTWELGPATVPAHAENTTGLQAGEEPTRRRGVGQDGARTMTKT